MDLPTFRYHRDPLLSGSIVASDRQCECCGEARGYIYTGPVYAVDDLEDAICPWCIANGAAHEKYEAAFVDCDAFPEDVPEPIIDEISYRTPGYSAWQQQRWFTCCGDAMSFVEPAGTAELRARYPRLEGDLMSNIVYDLGISGGAARRMLDTLDRDQGPTAFIFQCPKCESYR